MKFRRAFIIAAMLLVGTASQSFAFRGAVLVPVPVPVAPAPVYYGPPEVVAVPFFYGGWWWFNDGGRWYRSHHRHGHWGRPYRGSVPHGVRHYRY